MLSRFGKLTLAWVTIAAIALQAIVAPVLAAPYPSAPVTLAAATQLPQPDPKFTGKVGTTYSAPLIKIRCPAIPNRLKPRRTPPTCC
jgi:hypothetical protein